MRIIPSDVSHSEGEYPQLISVLWARDGDSLWHKREKQLNIFHAWDDINKLVYVNRSTNSSSYPFVAIKRDGGMGGPTLKKKTNHLVQVCLGVTSKHTHTLTHMYDLITHQLRRHVKRTSQRVFCGLSCLYKRYILLRCGFITAITQTVSFTVG